MERFLAGLATGGVGGGIAALASDSNGLIIGVAVFLALLVWVGPELLDFL